MLSQLTYLVLEKSWERLAATEEGLMRTWLRIFFWMTIGVITVDILLVCYCTVKQRK